MKSLAILGAAALAASSMVPAAASASPDRHMGHGWKWKTVCTTKWRHGHKMRQCRKVRVRW